MIADLNDMVAYVTGAASGIGRAVVDCFVEQGAFVAATDLNASLLAELAACHGRDRVRTSVVDVTSAEDVMRSIDDVASTFGKLDILVCSAGIVFANDAERAANVEADWDRTFAVNVRGTVHACEAALPHLGTTSGAIVTIGSMSAHASRGTSGAYPASKAAALRYTKSLALTAAPAVRVNAVCPGAVWSGMQARIQDEVRKFAGDDFNALDDQQAFLEFYKGVFPLQRPQPAEHVAKAVAFLASKDAASITGQCLHVDGGAVIRD